jgi:hypothetical protein
VDPAEGTSLTESLSPAAIAFSFSKHTMPFWQGQDFAFVG